MKLAACKLLTDENIHRDVVQFLRRQGFDVLDVSAIGYCTPASRERRQF